MWYLCLSETLRCCCVLSDLKQFCHTFNVTASSLPAAAGWCSGCRLFLCPTLGGSRAGESLHPPKHQSASTVKQRGGDKRLYLSTGSVLTQKSWWAGYLTLWWPTSPSLTPVFLILHCFILCFLEVDHRCVCLLSSFSLGSNSGLKTENTLRVKWHWCTPLDVSVAAACNLDLLPPSSCSG